MGKTPKGYGTAEGKREAKQKYDQPKKKYTKSANPGGLETPKLSDKPKTRWTGKRLVKKSSADYASMSDELNQIMLSKLADAIPGGKADKKTDKDFDAKQMAMGEKVEMEHTNDRAKAREIARDHLEEFGDYYTRLNKMEHEAEKAKEKTAEGLGGRGRGAPGPGSGCSQPGRRLGQKGKVPRKRRFRLMMEHEAEKAKGE
jgi:hypothetical protein